jgi:hypothetical protein
MSAADPLAGVERRLSRHVRSWPEVTRRALAPYAGGRPARQTLTATERERYWTLLPQWLWSAGGGGKGAADRDFLDDVLWAQYCLFLFVRIHDDLLDGQARDASLVFVADDLLVECQRTFAAHLPRMRFQALLLEHLETTFRAILRVDALQARPAGMSEAALPLYASVSAIFKVGSAAVCLKRGRWKLFPRVAAFCDHMAIAGQILDDLFDVEEDLDRGRFNFAANVLLPGRAARAAHRSRHLARGVLRENGVARLLASVLRHVDQAGDAIAPARIPGVGRCLDTMRRQLDRLDDAVHRARVQFLLHGAGLRLPVDDRRGRADSFSAPPGAPRLHR